MAKTPTIRLQTNIPITGTVKYADIVDGKYGKQLQITGTFDGKDGKVYAPAFLIERLVQHGICEGESSLEELPWENDDGTPAMAEKFPVVDTTTPITISKTEDGTKKITEITLAGGELHQPPKAVRQAARDLPDLGTKAADDFTWYNDLIDWVVDKTLATASAMEITNDEAKALLFDRILSNATPSKIRPTP